MLADECQFFVFKAHEVELGFVVKCPAGNGLKSMCWSVIENCGQNYLLKVSLKLILPVYFTPIFENKRRCDLPDSTIVSLVPGQSGHDSPIQVQNVRAINVGTKRITQFWMEKKG